MNVVILANGQPPSRALLESLLSESDLFVATDGAAHTALALKVDPDLICGDFDSINMQQIKKEFPGAEFVETSDQFLGDLEKALRLVIDRGASRVTITGASGGRLDHLLGNISLLFRYHTEIDLHIVDEISEIRCISGTVSDPGICEIQAVTHDIISVFSFDGLSRTTMRGVRWPLENALIPIGTLGLSNEATSEEVIVQVTGGAIIVCHTHLCSQTANGVR